MMNPKWFSTLTTRQPNRINKTSKLILTQLLLCTLVIQTIRHRTRLFLTYNQTLS